MKSVVRMIRISPYIASVPSPFQKASFGALKGMSSCVQLKGMYVSIVSRMPCSSPVSSPALVDQECQR